MSPFDVMTVSFEKSRGSILFVGKKSENVTGNRLTLYQDYTNLPSEDIGHIGRLTTDIALEVLVGDVRCSLVFHCPDVPSYRLRVPGL